MALEAHNKSFHFKNTQRTALTKLLEKELSSEASGDAIASLEHSISQYAKDVAGCTSAPALQVLNELLTDLDGLNTEFHARFDRFRVVAEELSSDTVDWRYNDLDAVPSEDTLGIIGINESDLEVAALLVQQAKGILARSVSAGENVPDKSLRMLCGSIAGALSNASGKPRKTIRNKKWFQRVLAIVLDAVNVQASPDTIYLAANAKAPS